MPCGKLTSPLAGSIVDALARDIESGKLKPGDRLPTHRELAERLGCAIGTVTRAYALAKEQGLITGTTGRGTFVAGDHPRESGDGLSDLSQNLVVRDPRDTALRDVLGAFGDPGRVAGLLDSHHPAAGLEAHREAAARWIAKGGLQPAAGDVVICAGVQHALHIVLATTAQPGDTVMAEDVTYAGIKAIAALLHLRPEGLSLDEEGLRPDALEAACRRGGRILYVTPTLHNPTTATMSDERRRQIAQIVQKYGVTVLEDDVYGFLAPDAPKPLAAYAPEHTYYLMSTSKSISPGLRIAYACCPPGTAERVAGAVRTTIWATTPLFAELVTRWICDGTFDRTIAWKRKETEARNEIARNVLGAEHAPRRTSPHWWLAVPARWSTDDLVATCRARGVVVTAAAAFSVSSKAPPNAVRVCLASTSTRERLESALRIVKDTLEDAPVAGFSVT